MTSILVGTIPTGEGVIANLKKEERITIQLGTPPQGGLHLKEVKP